MSSASYVPTPAQIAAHEQLLALKSQHAAPPLGPHTTALQVAAPGGPQTDPTVKQAATDFTVFKNSLINSTCSGCAQSTVNEPSTANSGKNIIAISNWNIAYALNGGAGTITWQNQDPYTLSSGYCCDQIILYNPDRDVFVMLLLDYAGEGASTNGLTISTARGTAPTSWCTYKFTGANFGEGATDTLDFPKIVISNNNLYLTWNDYPPNAGFRASGLARMPLDSLASCTTVNFNYLTRTTEFTFALTQQGAHDQFYWVSNWFLDGTVDGSNLRIFHWADNSGTYFFNTVAINAFNFTMGACNWCGRLDPRSESVVITPAEYRAQANSAFAGDQILEVAGTAGPSSFSNGNNYVVYNYFKLNSLAYIGNDETYNTSYSFGYPSCATNAKGYVGCAMVEGTNPGGLILLQDNVSPTQPWGFDFVLAGASSNSSWGDYTWTNPWLPGGGPFETVLWNVAATGVVHPHYIVWGRGADANDYSRWKAK
ncbi:MAG TPA: hypothetical protein VFE63_09110 [Roseiarcus sp.]|nr:hypothetical protein [Roseiarcus sp.]